MSGKILNRLGINACIEQICDVGVPELVGCHFKIKGVDDPWVVFLAGSQGRLYRVLDALPVHIFIIGALLGGTDNNVLPHSFELRIRQGLSLAVGNHIIGLGGSFRFPQAVGQALRDGNVSPGRLGL